MPKNIGVVIHYFPKISVAIVKLTSGDIKLGDTIKFVQKNGEELTQKIVSMQIEHTSIEIAKSGDEFGVKVDKPPTVGSKIVKV